MEKKAIVGTTDPDTAAARTSIDIKGGEKDVFRKDSYREL